jgi:hypothetical protein
MIMLIVTIAVNKANAQQKASKSVAVGTLNEVSFAENPRQFEGPKTTRFCDKGKIVYSFTIGGLVYDAFYSNESCDENTFPVKGQPYYGTAKTASIDLTSVKEEQDANILPVEEIVSLYANIIPVGMTLAKCNIQKLNDRILLVLTVKSEKESAVITDEVLKEKDLLKLSLKPSILRLNNKGVMVNKAMTRLQKISPKRENNYVGHVTLLK